MTVVCTLLLEALPEEPEKSICDLMAKTIHSITVTDFPNNCSYILTALMVKIYFNSDPGQALWVYNDQLVLSKVCKKYVYKSSPLLLPLSILLSHPNKNSLEAALVFKQVLITL